MASKMTPDSAPGMRPHAYGQTDPERPDQSRTTSTVLDARRVPTNDVRSPDSASRTEPSPFSLDAFAGSQRFRVSSQATDPGEQDLNAYPGGMTPDSAPRGSDPAATDAADPENAA